MHKNWRLRFHFRIYWNKGKRRLRNISKTQSIKNYPSYRNTTQTTTSKNGNLKHNIICLNQLKDKHLPPPKYDALQTEPNIICLSIHTKPPHLPIYYEFGNLLGSSISACSLCCSSWAAGSWTSIDVSDSISINWVFMSQVTWLVIVPLAEPKWWPSTFCFPWIALHCPFSRG